eukprot:gene2358-2589_t
MKNMMKILRFYPSLLVLTFRTILFRSLTIGIVDSKPLSSPTSTSTTTTSTSYSPVPSDLSLDQVIIIHRHGDRAQISRSLGSNYPESLHVTEKWKSLLPTEATCHLMRAAAVTAADLTATNISDITLDGSLYSGIDRHHIPYGQLTNKGAQQLLTLGRRLRQRYLHAFPTLFQRTGQSTGNHNPSNSHSLSGLMPSVTPALYLRSSHYCRTLQSIRCLLIGLFQPNAVKILKDRKGDEHSHTTTSTTTTTWSLTRERLVALPFINTIAGHLEETIYPQSSTSCLAIAERKKELVSRQLLRKKIRGFDSIEKKVMTILGYSNADEINWLIVKEVLQTHLVHNIHYIEGLDEKDMVKIDEVATFIWSVMYHDQEMNRLSIGRFLCELLQDMESYQDRRFLIYSGHDSTLVPILCGLDVFDDVFPDYASYIALEVASGRSNGVKYIRLIYNDKILALPAALDRKRAQLKLSPRSIDRKAGNELEKSGWARLEDFTSVLSSMALTKEQYKRDCELAIRRDEEQKVRLKLKEELAAGLPVN